MECRMDQQDSVLPQDNQNNNQFNADAVADSSSITLVRKLFNSDFEIEGVKDYYNNGIFLKQINGWTGSGLIEVNTRYGGAQDSDFLIELNRDPTGKFQDAPSIGRTLATTEGALYSLDFDFASRPGLTELNNTIGLFINGVQVQGWTASGKGSTALQWQTGEFSFVGTGSEVVIEIRDLTADENLIDHGRGMLLDNISMTETLESQGSDETSTVLIDVLAGENDAQGLTISSLDSDVYHNDLLVGHAELVMVDGRQQVQFTPTEQLKALVADETAELTFNYTVTDSDDNADSATTTLTVQGVNNTPVATQDTYVMRYAGRKLIDVRENDSDVEGEALSVTHINGTALTVGQPIMVEIYQGVKPVRAKITLQDDGQLQIDHVGGNSLRDLYFESTLSDGNSSTQSIAAIQILPKVKADITAISEDTDAPDDFRTADLNGLTISGTLTAALLPEETLQITWPRSGGWQTVSVDNDTLSWSFDDNTGRSNADEVVYTTRIQDAFGRNLDVDKQTVVFESDVSPAEINITHISEDTGFFDDDFITADRTLEVYGILSEALGVSDRVEVTWDGGQTWYTATVNGTDWSYDSSGFEHAKLARPLYEVRIINEKGHIGDVDDQRVVVDSLPGRYNTISLDSISTDTGTEGDFFTQDNTLTINGSLLRNLGNDQMVWVYSDDDPDWRVQATVNNDDTWSVVDSRIHDFNDEIIYTAKIIDLAGNVMDEDSQLVVIDNTAPTVEIAITAISEDTGIADYSTADLDGITVSGTVGTLAADEAVQISLNGTDWFNATVDKTAGTWSYDDTSTRSDGDEVIYQARVIDGAGNVGDTTSQKVAFEVPIIEGNFSGDAREDVTLTVTGDLDIQGRENEEGFTAQAVQGQYGSLIMNQNGSWTYTLDNDHRDVQGQKPGQYIYDTLSVSTPDEAYKDIKIRIQGSEDYGRLTYSDSRELGGAGTRIGNYDTFKTTTRTITKKFVDRDLDYDDYVYLKPGSYSSGTATLTPIKTTYFDYAYTSNSSLTMTFRPNYKVIDDQHKDRDGISVPAYSGEHYIGNAYFYFFSWDKGCSKTPLILDLDGDGVETLGLDGDVVFDIDADGELEVTGWAGSDDGLLVRDLNGDGQINNGAELFGDSTLLQDGSKASDGYQVLQELDLNGDGVIDSQDAVFAELQLWQDKNSDGVAQAGELKSLQDAGVASLSTAAQTSDYVDENGNLHGLVSSYTTVDGEEREAVDVWFAVDESGNYHAGTSADDILTGGEGRDTFIWQSGDQGSTGQVASDTITDFDSDQDVLDLSAMLDFDSAEDVIGDYLSLTSNEQGDAVIEVSSSGGDVDQRIVLENISADVAVEASLISSLHDEGQLIL